MRLMMATVVLASLAVGGCAEIIVGPLIGGPIGAAVEKAIREEPKNNTPSAEDR